MVVVEILRRKCTRREEGVGELAGGERKRGKERKNGIKRGGSGGKIGVKKAQRQRERTREREREREIDYISRRERDR